MGKNMKRDDKNQIIKSKILSSAIAEFARHGYEAGSMNAICRNGGVSKGIIYHYFGSKDGLYLNCVQVCFEEMTAYLSEKLSEKRESCDRLSDYFDARMNFFKTHENYARIFCSAVILPPAKLRDEIAERRKSFDVLNRTVLREILR